VVLNVTLKFCPTDGGGGGFCCDGAADAALQEQFDAMAMKPGGACARLVKSILCSVRVPNSLSLAPSIFGVILFREAMLVLSPLYFSSSRRRRVLEL
jgi:hypothetical protein